MALEKKNQVIILSDWITLVDLSRFFPLECLNLHSHVDFAKLFCLIPSQPC